METNGRSGRRLTRATGPEHRDEAALYGNPSQDVWAGAAPGRTLREQDAGPDRAYAQMPELEEADLATLFGADGPLASQLPGYELRASQLQMAEAVKRAILRREHGLIEAPTGTGKSIAYLLPALLSGKTVVVATANKSLQSQLYTKDIPFLSSVLGQEIDAVVVKGRSNYICNLKWEQEKPIRQRLALYDQEDRQIRDLSAWLEETETGDVDDLPFMLSPDLRPRVVSFADDCLQRDCRFYADDCWINFMRDRAAQAQIIITNHHLLLNALELGVMGERLLPPAAIYVVDEAHQLEATATAVFETAVTDYTVEQLLARGVLKDHVDEDRLDELRFHNTLAFQEAAQLSRDNAYRIEPDLGEMAKLARALEELGRELRDKSPYPPTGDGSGGPGDEPSEERRAYDLTVEAVNSAASKLKAVATARHDDRMVRYAVRIFDRRHITLELHAAPIDTAQPLSRILFHPEDDEGPVERTVICTSATLAANGHFEHFKTRCGIQAAGEEHVLPSVFDYPSQALLYQPSLRPFDWRNADRYYDDAAAEIERLLEVSRGRSLCLFTSWSGLQQVADRLRSRSHGVIWPLRAQGDAPRDALLTWFRATPHSVLLATRSFWEGVDIPGDDLSLVVLDKMPFPAPKDPLHSARMRLLDENGRSSFADYMIPLMTLSLKQGFGRLVRRSTDQGVVAILDERLTSKRYGQQVRRDLPDAPYTRNFRDVHRFFQRSLTSQAEFGLNVWSGMLDNGDVYWRWRLARLQDGKADGDEGVAPGLEAADAEVHAALLALDNLGARIRQAGRETADFAVELRCRPAGLAALESPTAGDLATRWQETCRAWRGIHLLPVPWEMD